MSRRATSDEVIAAKRVRVTGTDLSNGVATTWTPASAAFVRAEDSVDLQRVRLGLTREQFALPPTLVATFQRAAYERILMRAGAEDHLRAGSGGVGTWLLGRAVGAVDGVPVVLSRISVGGPAAALALEEAFARGVRTVLVIGSAGSLQPHLPIGSTVVLETAEQGDGTSLQYLPGGPTVNADPNLIKALLACAAARGSEPVPVRSWTVDAPYRVTTSAVRRQREAGVAVVEMEAAAIFAVAQTREMRGGVIVAVSDALLEVWDPAFDHGQYLEALVRAADAAMDVVGELG